MTDRRRFNPRRIGRLIHFSDGQGRGPKQCEGCTFCASQLLRPDHLHARDIIVAGFCEGDYDESSPYAYDPAVRDALYSARDSASLVAGREFGFHSCYVRDSEDRVYETYWTTDRGTEAALWSYGLMDLTVLGRQEAREDSPAGWPRIPEGQHQRRSRADRPRSGLPPTSRPSQPRPPATTTDAAECRRLLVPRDISAVRRGYANGSRLAACCDRES